MIKKIFKLLTKQERKQLYMLFGAMVISAIIEVAGIASILPFLSLITNPGLIQSNRYLKWLYTSLNFQSNNRFLILVGATVLVILIVSNILALLMRWALTRFSSMRTYTISRSLLINYLYQPYIFFLNHNTSTLGKDILSEVEKAVGGVILPLLDIFSRGIVALFVFAMLLAVNPILALSLIIVLGGAYLFIYKFIKQKLYNMGKKSYEFNTERFKALDEAFGDIRLIKLRGCENYFVNSYSKPSVEIAKYNASYAIITQTPRYLMEIIAFGGIIIVVLYLLASGKGIQNLLPLIGLYAFATYRLMPSLQAIFAAASQMRFSTKSIDSLYETMRSFNNEQHLSSTDKEKIERLLLKKEFRLESVTFSYPKTHEPVIQDLNLKAAVNSSVALVGVTGAGKTTIANIILGLLKPDTGRILVDGIEITDENLSNWQRNLGYIPQDIYLQDDTVARNIAFGIPDDSIDLNVVGHVAKIANIHNFIVEQLPDGYQTLVGERGVRLSGGQRQRIGIARALYNNPGVLVLDEATSALDGATEREVFAAIQNVAKTKTLIIIAHRLTTIKECDVIYVLKNGIITGIGKYDELIETNENFRKIASVKSQEEKK
ncbi:MAG: ABC transporter ATP-binding protein [Actinobacteria bacterium]|nr:ABC transporter ATP-binding protein [Actinomycetota bacterium]